MFSLSLGPVLALVSAALFGASTPFAKALLAGVDPWLLAGILYLGSGVGLGLLSLARRRRGPLPDRADLPWLGGAILAGGVVAPVLLLLGLQGLAGSTASLLLNAEVVLTALIAWGLFRENAGRRVMVGLGAIVAGAVILSWPGASESGPDGTPWAVLALLGACLGWAIDNNLTRKVSLNDPLVLAGLKGGAAGLTNVVLALGVGHAALPSPSLVAAGAGLGFLGYGLSLVAFVVALRLLGTARTGAYFATAPFIGALMSVLVLGEPLSGPLLVAAGLMGWGVWLHLTEQHTHAHDHPALTHVHTHDHANDPDGHHRHEHPPGNEGLPHCHPHTHPALSHRHAHVPDAHHRHAH
ncbi:DMT family transporter [Pararhodospirillum photometricum]|nr:DMT family transporter [Pararhodospirillum photometricum]